MIDEWDESEVSDLEDEYTLLGELGRGGSAVVYRARDRSLFRDVAIKVVRPKFAASAEEALARLAREARTVARLQHPNIVTVHAVKRLHDGGLALVMQLVPGRTLKQAVIDDGPFDPERAERVLKDVAEALAFAHSKGVVHRDVKPENIFLEAGTGRALLSDFGIAHSSEFESRLTMTGAAIGTPAYMSPEQIDGAPANARSDIYSLGLVAWEMLTGERPWEGEALYNVIFKQKNDELPAIDALRPGEVPPRLQYIVERMLQKKPNARWAGADGLLTALNSWVVPNDWRQWEESHRRRREAERANPRAKVIAKDAASDATVRFARPSDGPQPTPALGNAALPAIASATPHSVTATTADDAAPSWATVPEPPSRKWMYALVGVFAVVMLGGGFAIFAQKRGLFRTRVAPTTTLADARSVELPVVAPVVPDSVQRSRDTVAARSRADSLHADSLRADSLDHVKRVVDSVRADSMAAAAMARAQRRAARIAAPASPIPASTPVPVVEAPRVDAVRSTDDPGTIAAGGGHSCGIVSAKAYCWGTGDRGQLGTGDQESRDTPALVVGEVDFTMITTGGAHSCALARGGDAYCWGADDRGQLGDGTTISRSAPVRVSGNQSYRVLRAGKDHTCGLTSSGEVHCWGLNGNGQLGDGSTLTRSSPVAVSASVRFVSLSAGWNHTCGIASEGTAYCWGQNASGQLGNGSRTDARAPLAVSGGLKFTSISAGSTHTCAVSDVGEVWCWGRNTFGQLGIGGTSDQLAPTKVEGQTRFVSVTVGGVHSCARTRGGQAWCWGRNVYGQVGDGTNVNREVPTRVVGSSSFTSINATGAHTCGIGSDGETNCWGYNVGGQLGDGTRNHHSRPMRVTLPGR
jgi:serine/threonine protein kinase/alpha-tubulin suppressor-like RCC1 family protein